DFVIVETVGVGQSEVSVANMVDCFLMLQLPNAGDELQGIKKGIMELADIVAITKCDGANEHAAKLARAEHERALHMTRGRDAWEPPVLTCSGVTGHGLPELYAKVNEFITFRKKSGQFDQHRHDQAIAWFDAEILAAMK